MSDKFRKFQELIGYFQFPDNEEEDIMRVFTELTAKRSDNKSPNYEPETTTPRLGSLENNGGTPFQGPARFGNETAGSIIPMKKVEKPSSALATVPTTTDTSAKKSESKKSEETIKLIGKNYNAHRKHQFVKIKDCTFVSCSSITGIYSQIDLILWLEQVSGSTGFYSERGRIIISLMYDSEDDIWSISSKLIRRSSYSTAKDEEEATAGNRLCRTSEIRKEIKHMLLYLGVSPREIYRMLRRAMTEDLVFVGENTGILIFESLFHKKMLEALEKPQSTNTNNYNNWSGGYDRHGRQDYTSYKNSHLNQVKDSMKEMQNVRTPYGDYLGSLGR